MKDNQQAKGVLFPPLLREGSLPLGSRSFSRGLLRVQKKITPEIVPNGVPGTVETKELGTFETPDKQLPWACDVFLRCSAHVRDSVPLDPCHRYYNWRLNAHRLSNSLHVPIAKEGSTTFTNPSTTSSSLNSEKSTCVPKNKHHKNNPKPTKKRPSQNQQRVSSTRTPLGPGGRADRTPSAACEAGNRARRLGEGSGLVPAPRI